MIKFVGKSETIDVYFVDTVAELTQWSNEQIAGMPSPKIGTVARVTSTAATYVFTDNGKWVNQSDSSDQV